MSATILDRFVDTCREGGGRALFERPGRAPITRDEALATVRRLAGALDALGVRDGDRVAVQVDKCPEAVLLYLACLQVGAVFLPLNTAYTGAEIDYFLDDAEPRLFVCRPDALGEHARRASGELAVETLGTEADGSLADIARERDPCTGAAPRGVDDAAAILYTSGTTGRSKGAVLTHGNLDSNCAALIDCWRFTSDDRLIHALPIFHTHGLFVAANMALASGATMLFLERFDADEVVSLMDEATVLMGVPTFYTRLLRSERLNREAVAGMRLFVSGSAPLSTRDHEDFAARTGHAILERYGMTETCMIASNPYDGERRPGAVGFALPGVELRVVDPDTGETVPGGGVGAIEVRGPNVFRKYWRMPDKTAAEFRDDGFFVTGDLGTIDADGYLSIVGRSKDLVISGGYNVYPKEIESRLDALPEVLESAVIGLPHADLGEAVTAVVVPRPGHAPDPAALLASLDGSLARYKRPRRLLLVDELPRNVMGKVQKAELRERHARLYDA